ncbi:hypothetical protein IMZ48_20720 [Candidatus Bathyarchaeota archaeon]|nr:hypothetical protein [Candidatus Bathyarchaeota archaeon]
MESLAVEQDARGKRTRAQQSVPRYDVLGLFHRPLVPQDELVDTEPWPIGPSWLVQRDSDPGDRLT